MATPHDTHDPDHRPSGGVLMGSLARFFVNRRGRGARNVAQVRPLLDGLDTPTPRDALEIGCGAGAVATWLATERGMAVVATDLDPRQVAVARTRRPPGAAVRHAVMDASRMALGTARFDLVIAQYMLHHVPDWPGLLQETARVLRPGGHLLWLDFALPGWLVRSHHAGPFHGPSVTAACAAAGLTRVRYEGPALGVGTQRAVFRKGSP